MSDLTGTRKDGSMPGCERSIRSTLSFTASLVQFYLVLLLDIKCFAFLMAIIVKVIAYVLYFEYYQRNKNKSII